MKTALLAAILAMIMWPVAAEFTPWTSDFDTYTVGENVNDQNDGWNSPGDSVQVMSAPDGRKALLISAESAPRLGNGNIFQIDPATNLPYSQCVSFDVNFADTPTSLTDHFYVDYQVNVLEWLMRDQWQYLVAFGYVRDHEYTASTFEYRTRSAEQTNPTQYFDRPFEARTWYHMEMMFDMDALETWITVQPEGGPLWESDKMPLNCGGPWQVELAFFAGYATAYTDDGVQTSVPIRYFLNNVSVQALPTVPEPATMSLLALGGLAMLRRWR